MRAATLALLACCTGTGGASKVPEVLRLPEVPLSSLLQGKAGSEALAALASLGALAVTGTTLGELGRSSLEAWAHCLRPDGEARGAAVERTLAEGAVRRLTVASGGVPTKGPLAEWPRCAGAPDDAVEMRAAVSHTAHALAKALSVPGEDALLVERLGTNGSRRGVKRTATLAEALREAKYLEHLHLYEEAASQEEATIDALQLHTDAGFLLAFVPPMSAGSAQVGGAQQPFLDVELPDGRGLQRLAAPAADSVLFFVGEAAQHLVSTKPLRPLPHALTLPTGFGWRAWYGAMFLLPEDAVVRSSAQRAARTLSQEEGPVLTFGEVWRAAQGGEGLAEGVGCAKGQSLADPENTCPEGEIMCWMKCRSAVGLKQCSGTTWTPSGVGKILAPVTRSVQCLNQKTGDEWKAGQHCKDCMPSCAVSTGSLAPVEPSPNPSPTPSSSLEGDVFCQLQDGLGTTMYMDGFKFSLFASEDACIAFLFPAWVLNTPWKFALACLGVILISSSLELVGVLRKRTANWGGKLGLQAVTLMLAYVAMLFVMTYSLELFACVIIGLVLGPVLAARISDKPSSLLEAPHQTPSEVEVAQEGGVGAGAPCCRMAAGEEANGLA